MFHLVDFKGGRKRTVVPDTWLSINDTLCLLPPNVTDQDLDVLARNRVEPGEGWQIFGVSSLETFENYADAKKQLERTSETPQSQADSQRKRKKPGYLADYDVLDSGGGQPSYTVFRTEDDEEDASENEWNPPSASQFIPLVRKVSSCQRIIQKYGNKRRIMQFNQSRPPFKKQTAEIKCACKSSCHGTILQALQSMQQQLNKTNKMVQQLLMARPESTQFQPKRSLFRQPTNHVNDQDEEEDNSQDDTSFLQSILQNQARSTTQKRKRSETPTSFASAEDTYITGDLPSRPETDVLKSIDIRKWLMSHPKGRELMQKLDSEIFFPKDRQQLVRIVCKKLIEENGNAYPSTKMKEKVAQEIVNTFPFLKSSRGAGYEAFYDIKTGTGFIDYRLKTIRRVSLPSEERKNHTQQVPKGPDAGELIAVKEELLSPSDQEENVAWMAQQEPDEENKTMIIAKLRETMKNRQKEIKETDMSVAEIFNRYPRLKDYKGEMVNMEFSELYSNGDKFLQKFESYFAPRILTYVTLHKPNLLLHVPNCEDNLKGLVLLPELLPSPNYNKGKKGSQTPKASKIAQTGPNFRKVPNPDLIIFVNSEENFTEVNENDAQSLQPYLICVNCSQETGGKKYYIRVDETLIEGPDEPMAAFDVLFKLHYVFNVQYAKSLENFYNFVSSVIYEIDTPRSSSDAFYTLLRNIPVVGDE